ncbi:MAG TPA: hypothetical protein VK674_07645 [Candidatus Limnocylindria bacterium]|nr:hypothetical protein [Candidatus Limnocylindria bacterium]
MQKTTKIAGAAVLVGGGLFMGYGALQDAECLGETIGMGAGDPNLLACAPEFSLGQQTPAHAEFGDLNVQAHELTGKAEILSLGEVTILIGGDRSTFDWDDPQLIDSPDIDATLYWNRDGDKTTSVLFNPCIKLSDDYEEGINPNAVSEIGADGTAVEPSGPAGTVEYAVDVVDTPARAEQTGKPIGTPLSVRVNAGILDSCFGRIPNTPENNSVWAPDHDNQTQFGGAEEATFRWQQNQLILHYALREACGESELNMDAVEQRVAEAVIGDIVLRPDVNIEETQLRQLWEGDEFDVMIQPPDVRREFYEKQFEDVKDQIADMKESFPDEDGDTHSLEKPDFGSFEVTECKADVAEG